MTLEVATDVLIDHAKRRYEDSYAYHGLYNFIVDVTAVPRWAWSDLPWSDDWRRGWEASSELRSKEAGDIRDVMAGTGGSLLKVAAEFTETELEIELTFTRIDPFTGEQDPLLANQDTSVYLDHYQQDVNGVTVRPGSAPMPDFPERPPPVFADGTTVFPYPPTAPSGVTYPSDHPRLQPLLEERPPRGWGTWMREGAAGVTFSSQEDDALQLFVEEFGPTLMRIEGDAVALDPSVPRPWSEMVEPAWLSAPSIIHDRADLIGSVANSYVELQDALSYDSGLLKVYWGGTTAETFFVHAGAILTYLERLRDKAELLASEGKQAAKVLRELRLAYADIGADHVDRMIKAHEEYIATTTTSIGRLAGCTSPEGAAQGLIAEIGDYHRELAAARRPALDQARDMLNLEAVAVAGAPDFGTGHAQAERPSGLDSQTAWDNGTSWDPRTAG